MQAASCAWKTGGCVPGLLYPLIITSLSGFFLFPSPSCSQNSVPCKTEKNPQPIQQENKSKPTENWNLQALVAGMVEVQAWLRDQEATRQTEVVR